MSNSINDLKKFQVKTKFWSFIHSYYRVYNDADELIAITKAKGFKLKEDMRIYTDEAMTQEIMSITTQNIIDFSASYQVKDSQTGEILGSIRREGFTSLMRDTWVISDVTGQALYKVSEESLLLALMRRFIIRLIPATYKLERDGVMTQCQFKQNFNPFLLHYRCDLSDWSPELDKRLALAMVILLLAIEGKQG